MKIKHSKYKNTGILFELLTRQLTSDTISGGSSKSLDFIKKHFNSKTELLKEYKIYHTLVTKKLNKESKANILINTLIESYNKLNKSKLRREKYNLIKEIKNNYDITDFFNSKINNYKVMASVFNLLENKKASPQSIVNSKITILEHVTQTKTKKQKSIVNEELKNSDKNTRLLTYKVILEKFNNKYKGLANNQKLLLQEYVNSVSNSPALKLYINEEIKKVKNQLTKYENKVEDKAIVVKLKETKDLIHPIGKNLNVHDDNVTNLLNYYELINELKTIHG
jgi:hypothetical protein